MKAGILDGRVAADPPGPSGREPRRPRPEGGDFLGFPAARIAYSPHQHEKAAAVYLGARMQAIHGFAPGAVGAVTLPMPLLNDEIAARRTSPARAWAPIPRTSVCAPSTASTTSRTCASPKLHLSLPTFPGFQPHAHDHGQRPRIARGIAGRLPKRSDHVPAPQRPGRALAKFRGSTGGRSCSRRAGCLGGGCSGAGPDQRGREPGIGTASSVYWRTAGYRPYLIRWGLRP